MNMREMMTLFLDSRKQGTTGAKKRASPKTVDIYKRNIGIFVEFMGSGVGDDYILDYSQLRRTHLIKFLDHIDSLHTSGKWSLCTNLQMLRCLKTFFRWVDKDEDCQSAAHKGLQKYLPSIQKTPQRTDIPQVKVIKSFLNSLNIKNRWGHRDYVATCLMLDTGIRLGEVCNLKLDNMLLDQKVLMAIGKTGPRPVLITEEMVSLLKGWLKRRSAKCKSSENSPYVFVSKRGPRMTVDGFGHRYRKHCAKLGLGRITAHTFRHTFCTNYLQKGGDIERLRLMTGHASYEMLRNYLHLAKLGEKSAHSELEKVSLLKQM